MLVCFLLNNLLFTYSSEQVAVKKTEETATCQSDDDCCGSDSTEDTCCEKENCCANVPATSSHISFSAIVGIDKKNEAIVPNPTSNSINRSDLRSASELSDGHSSSLIKPPATV